MFDIRMLGADECIKEWSNISLFLNKALSNSRGEWTTNDILKKVLNDPINFHVWEVINEAGDVVAIASTRIINYNHFDSLHIIALTAVENDDFDKWEDYATEALEALVDRVKKAGLERIEFTGRKGWMKKLKPIGWTEQYITMDLYLGE
jgi:hypothetical protein